VVDGEVVQNTPRPRLRSFEVTHASPPLPGANQRFLREILGYADVTSENDAKGDEAVACFEDEVLEVSFQPLIFQAALAAVISLDDSITTCALVGVAVEPRDSFHDMYTFKDRRCLRRLRGGSPTTGPDRPLESEAGCRPLRGRTRRLAARTAG
jgi:hypothetical protein